MKPTKEVIETVIESIREWDVEAINLEAGHEERDHPTEEGVKQARSNGELTLTINAKIKDFIIKPWTE